MKKHLENIGRNLTNKDIVSACENHPYVGIGTDGILYAPVNDRLIITENTEFVFEKPGSIKISIPSYCLDLNYRTGNIGWDGPIGESSRIFFYIAPEDGGEQDFEMYTYNDDGSSFQVTTFSVISYLGNHAYQKSLSTGASSVSTTIAYGTGIEMINYDILMKSPGIVKIKGISDSLSQMIHRCHYTLLDSEILVTGGELKEILFPNFELRKKNGTYFIWEGDAPVTIYDISIANNVDITSSYCKEILTIQPGEIVNMYDTFAKSNTKSWLVHSKLVSDSDGVLKVVSPQLEPDTTLIDFGSILEPGNVYAMFPKVITKNVRFKANSPELFTINIYSSSSCTADTLLVSKTCIGDSYIPYKVTAEYTLLQLYALNNNFQFIYITIDSLSPVKVEVQEATSEDSYFVYHLNDVLKLSSSKNKPKLLYAEIYDKDILIKWDGTTRISFKVLKANKSTQVFSQIINKKSTLLIDKETVNSWKDVVDGRGYLWLSISATSGNITITDLIEEVLE